MLLAIIGAPHFCACLDLTGRRAAPIIRYMREWSHEKIEGYCKSKGWALSWVACQPKDGENVR